MRTKRLIVLGMLTTCAGFGSVAACSSSPDNEIAANDSGAADGAHPDGAVTTVDGAPPVPDDGSTPQDGNLPVDSATPDDGAIAVDAGITYTAAGKVSLSGTYVHMASSPSLKKVFVLWETITHPVGPPVYANGVDVIDETTATAVAHIALPADSFKAWSVGINESTGRVYVLTEAGIYTIDGKTNALTAGDPLQAFNDAGYYVHPLAFASDNGNVYILGNQQISNAMVVVLDGTNDAIKARVDLPNTQYAAGTQLTAQQPRLGGVVANKTTHKIYVLTDDDTLKKSVLNILDGTTFAIAEAPATYAAATPGPLYSDPLSANVYFTVGNTFYAVDPATVTLPAGWVPDSVSSYEGTTIGIHAYNCTLGRDAMFRFYPDTGFLGDPVLGWEYLVDDEIAHPSAVNDLILWGPPATTGDIAVSYKPDPCDTDGGAPVVNNIVQVFHYK